MQVQFDPSHNIDCLSCDYCYACSDLIFRINCVFNIQVSYQLAQSFIDYDPIRSGNWPETDEINIKHLQKVVRKLYPTYVRN